MATKTKEGVYPDSSDTSTTSPVHKRLVSLSGLNNGKGYRRERAKELQNLSMKDLIELVIQGEYKVEKTENQLQKVVVKYKEQIEAEQQALEQAKQFRTKMTQTVIDSQQEAIRARQDIAQYKLRLENAQREIKRGVEVVKILEDNKEEMEHALQRARERARHYRERTAIQLAREQGRRIGFEQGLQQGRFAAQQLSEVQSSPENRLEGGSRDRAPGVRRALTQGPEQTSSSGTASQAASPPQREIPGNNQERRRSTRQNSLEQPRSVSASVRDRQTPTRRSSADAASVKQSSRLTRRSSADAASVKQNTALLPLGSGQNASTSVTEIVIPSGFAQKTQSDSGRSNRSRKSESRPSIPPPEAFTKTQSEGSGSSGSKSSTSRPPIPSAEAFGRTQSDGERSIASRTSRRSSAPDSSTQERPKLQSQDLIRSIPVQEIRPLNISHDKRPIVPQQPKQANTVSQHSYMPMPAPPASAMQPVPGSRVLQPRPPAQQFADPYYRPDLTSDLISEVSTSPASTMTGIDIVTFKEPPPESGPSHAGSTKRGREHLKAPGTGLHPIPEDVAHLGSRSAGPVPVAAPPSASAPLWFTNPPFDITLRSAEDVARPPIPQVDINLLSPGYQAEDPLRSAKSTTSFDSRQSSGSLHSYEIQVVPPSQPTSPTNHESTNDDIHYLSPNRPAAPLPSVGPSAPVTSDPPETPVLPVRPRIVPISQPTLYGTPATHPAEILAGPSVPRGARLAHIYAEAPTPPGFQYPIPLGATSGGGPIGKGKDKEPPIESPTSTSSQTSITRHHQPVAGSHSPGSLYATSLGYGSGGVGGNYHVHVGSVQVPMSPGNFQSSPFSGGSPGRELDSGSSDYSFDSATKRNTQMNAQLYGSKKRW
ncbi:hypothetical protein AMATHDRAFT_50085 [Amanita thiersii Skay4041]|uniref:Uncharacterized protein n=1 Tax=Amanita thiersii Skay4041 TaxID=703135 RepID=A0A2A9NEI3_9AGAR|nr:hypothetical protein AMATHDRAFT_50085 [Amanita thiersii Skay4041]